MNDEPWTWTEFIEGAGRKMRGALEGLALRAVAAGNGDRLDSVAAYVMQQERAAPFSYAYAVLQSALDGDGWPGAGDAHKGSGSGPLRRSDGGPSFHKGFRDQVEYDAKVWADIERTRGTDAAPPAWLVAVMDREHGLQDGKGAA